MLQLSSDALRPGVVLSHTEMLPWQLGEVLNFTGWFSSRKVDFFFLIYFFLVTETG